MKAAPHSKTNTLDIETFTIKPNEGYKIKLGTFRPGTEPRFRVIYHDHNLESPNVVTHRDVQLDQPHGMVTLIRLFQSYSQREHTITVRFASEADKELCCD